MQDNNDNLINYAREGNLKKIEECLINGTDVNAKDSNGYTALMVVSYNGNLEVVKYLVENGADINIKDDTDKTALDVAKKEKETEIIEYLESLK